MRNNKEKYANFTEKYINSGMFIPLMIENKIKVDDKDRKILDLLKENSKLSTSKISKKLNLPITTVFHRMKKLEKNGVIKKYTIDIDEIK